VSALEHYSVVGAPYENLLSLLVAGGEGAGSEGAGGEGASGASSVERTLFVHLEHDPDEWAREALSPSQMPNRRPVCEPILWHALADPFDHFECVRACEAADAAATTCLVALSTLSHSQAVAAYRQRRTAVNALFGQRGNYVRIETPAAAAAATMTAVPMMPTPSTLAARIQHELCEREITLCGEATSPARVGFEAEVQLAARQTLERLAAARRGSNVG